MSNHKIAILIPVKNGMPYIKATLQSIINSTRYPHKIVIIDANSTDGTSEYCKEMAKFWPHIEVHRKYFKNPLRAINYGLEVCKPYDTLLTHHDVIFYNFYPKDWLAVMAEISKTKSNCGAIVSNNGYGISGKEYLEGLPWIGTWCTYIPRRVLNKVGYLDLKYEPGMGDDIDLTFRIKQIGCEIYVLGFEVIHHRFGEKPQDSNEVQIHKNANYFRKKFNLDKETPKFNIRQIRYAQFLF